MHLPAARDVVLLIVERHSGNCIAYTIYDGTGELLGDVCKQFTADVSDAHGIVKGVKLMR